MRVYQVRSVSMVFRLSKAKGIGKDVVPLEGGVIMLDIRFIRENQAAVEAGMKNRCADVDVKGLLALDDQRRSVVTQVEG